jgi:hypothetical protein
MKPLKLRISRQTLRPMTTSNLAKVVGGGLKTGDSDNCSSACVSECIACGPDSNRFAVCA